MRKLFILLFVGLFAFQLQAQTVLKFKATHKFEGTIYFDEIMWNPTQDIVKKNIVKITDKKITIENGKYWFIPGEQIHESVEEDHTKFIWKSTDENKTNIYLTVLVYEEFYQIFFEYRDVIFGYQMVLIKVK
jgi:hypothetical protein